MPICTKCNVPTPGGSKKADQDNSTYVCGKCQDKMDVKVWKEEVKGFTLDERGNRLNRKKFLQDKIKETEG